MNGVAVVQSWIQHLSLPSLLLVGLLVLAGFYSGRSMKYFRLPSIIGFMIIGVLSGPSLLNILNEIFMSRLSFITEIALGFVAVTTVVRTPQHYPTLVENLFQMTRI